MQLERNLERIEAGITAALEEFARRDEQEGETQPGVGRNANKALWTGWRRCVSVRWSVRSSNGYWPLARTSKLV